jgi:hypothetical protein
MAPAEPLRLHEEIMLLSLRDVQGTVATGFLEIAIAGAVLAELLLHRRIAVDPTRKQLVDLLDTRPTGDAVIDLCLERMADGRRRASLQAWVSRLAGIKNLRQRVALRLCDRGILRVDEDKVLLIFTRRIYPELNPAPERRIVERLRAAIFSDDRQLDPRTVALISLASSADLLNGVFGRRELRTRRKRIEQIVSGELTGKATKDVIAACQAAATVAVMAVTTAAAASH